MTRFLPARPLHPWFRSWTLLALGRRRIIQPDPVVGGHHLKKQLQVLTALDHGRIVFAPAQPLLLLFQLPLYRRQIGRPFYKDPCHDQQHGKHHPGCKHDP